MSIIPNALSVLGFLFRATPQRCFAGLNRKHSRSSHLMKTTPSFRALAPVLAFRSTTLHAQVPQLLNDDGRVAVGDPPVNPTLADMTGIPVMVFACGDVPLRVEFDGGGNDSQLPLPDQMRVRPARLSAFHMAVNGLTLGHCQAVRQWGALVGGSLWPNGNVLKDRAGNAHERCRDGYALGRSAGGTVPRGPAAASKHARPKSVLIEQVL
jgi:hypothetical protein